jgi:hypothetical protein
MKLINPTLITLNNVPHIKADNLEPVEVDSSSINELLNYTKKDRLGITGNLSSGWYIDIEKGIHISELSDRIEVREKRILLAKSGGYKEGLMVNPATFIDGKPYKVTHKAFLLPAKEDKVSSKEIEMATKFWNNVDNSYSKYKIGEFECRYPQCACTTKCTHYKNTNTEKSYTIEEIEKAIDMSVLENYQIEILKREIINNLKK